MTGNYGTVSVRRLNSSEYPFSVEPRASRVHQGKLLRWAIQSDVSISSVTGNVSTMRKSGSSSQPIPQFDIFSLSEGSCHCVHNTEKWVFESTESNSISFS